MGFVETRLYLPPEDQNEALQPGGGCHEEHLPANCGEDSKMLNLQSRGPKPLEVVSMDSPVDNTQLGFGVSA